MLTPRVLHEHAVVRVARGAGRERIHRVVAGSDRHFFREDRKFSVIIIIHRFLDSRFSFVRASGECMHETSEIGSPVCIVYICSVPVHSIVAVRQGAGSLGQYSYEYEYYSTVEYLYSYTVRL